MNYSWIIRVSTQIGVCKASKAWFALSVKIRAHDFSMVQIELISVSFHTEAHKTKEKCCGREICKCKPSLKAVFQRCVFWRTFTYVCSIRVNERVYVFWAPRTYRSKKRSTGNHPLYTYTHTAPILALSKHFKFSYMGSKRFSNKIIKSHRLPIFQISVFFPRSIFTLMLRLLFKTFFSIEGKDVASLMAKFLQSIRVYMHTLNKQ